jgi:hypothetical protein
MKSKFHWSDTSSDLSVASIDELLGAVDSVHSILNTASCIPEAREEYSLFASRVLEEVNKRIREMKDKRPA